MRNDFERPLAFVKIFTQFIVYFLIAVTICGQKCLSAVFYLFTCRCNSQKGVIGPSIKSHGYQAVILIILKVAAVQCFAENIRLIMVDPLLADVIRFRVLGRHIYDMFI